MGIFDDTVWHFKGDIRAALVSAGQVVVSASHEKALIFLAKGT